MHAPYRLTTVLFFAGCTLLILAGCGDDDAANDQPSTNNFEPEPVGKLVNPRDVPLPEKQRGLLRVYTGEPGFFVFVDGEPVLNDDDNERLTTPCEVAVPRGSHNLTVAKPGWRDLAHTINVGESSEVGLEPVEDQVSSFESVLRTAYFEAEVGAPMPLLSINTSGRELDPYLTPDGLMLLFAGDRAEGRGVYVSTRPSPWHFFDEPELLALSRSGDLPAAPSATGGALSIVYAVPEKGRIRRITRTGPLAPWDNADWLRFGADADVVWPSAQILPDGLRLYWTSRSGDELHTHAAVRSRLKDDFGKTLDFNLAGRHPCLSGDGLRQYAFDGRTLSRATRADVRTGFSEPETVTVPDLPNYTNSTLRRQFFVSDDEQWLVYSDDPDAAGDLYIVRLFKGRNWGRVPRGRKIEPRPVVALTNSGGRQDGGDQPFIPPKKEVDPRTLPLPYAVHLESLKKHVAARDYTAAAKQVDAAIQDPHLAADRQQLAWDREDVARLKSFWEKAQTAVNTMKAGDEIRVGRAKLDLVDFKDGVVRAKSKNSMIEKPLKEFSASDVVALVDDRTDRKDAAAQLEVGTFLFYDPAGNDRLAAARFERVGEEGQMLLDRIPARLLHLVEAEFARENAGAGLVLIRRIRNEFPDTSAARKAAQLAERLYTLTKWEPRGGRDWGGSNDGVYVADSNRVPNAVLVSPREYENFELMLEWKTAGRTGQGGVYFRWPAVAAVSTDNAYKIRLANDYGVPADRLSTGSLFTVEGPSENAVKPEGQWNTLVLRVHGAKVEVRINDRRVLDATAESATIPLKGRVALDGEVGGITYRRVRLIELPAE